jgi:hypothetical protein
MREVFESLTARRLARRETDIGSRRERWPDRHLYD